MKHVESKRDYSPTNKDNEQLVFSDSHPGHFIKQVFKHHDCQELLKLNRLLTSNSSENPRTRLEQTKGTTDPYSNSRGA